MVNRLLYIILPMLTMRHELYSEIKVQQGFTMLSAIFLLIILAGLAVFLVAISTMQQIGTAMDVQGVRATQAARAGVEWGMYQSLRNGVCANSTLTFSGTTLADFTTAISCVRTVENELGTTLNFDQIIATACNQPPCPNAAPGQNYVERQWAVTTER